MARHEQLRLINTTNRWQIDEHTREVGRRGLAEARAALAAATARRDKRDQERKKRPHTSAA